jgi:hypothetical protein
VLGCCAGGYHFLPPLGHEISLHYALGEYFDDVRRYEEAFGQYRQANELTKRYEIKYNRKGLTQRIEQILASHPAAFGAGEVTFTSRLCGT